MIFLCATSSIWLCILPKTSKVAAMPWHCYISRLCPWVVLLAYAICFFSDKESWLNFYCDLQLGDVESKVRPYPTQIMPFEHDTIKWVHKRKLTFKVMNNYTEVFGYIIMFLKVLHCNRHCILTPYETCVISCWFGKDKRNCVYTTSKLLKWREAFFKFDKCFLCRIVLFLCFTGKT